MVTTLESNNFVLQSNGNLDAVEVATFFSLVLYGISLSQGYTYFLENAKRDRFALKALVSTTCMSRPPDYKKKLMNVKRSSFFCENEFVQYYDHLAHKNPGF